MMVSSDAYRGQGGSLQLRKRRPERRMTGPRQLPYAWTGITGFSNSSKKLILNIPGARHKECAGFSDSGCPQSPIWPRGEASWQFRRSPPRGLDWAEWEEVRETQELQGTGTETQFSHRLTCREECWHIPPLCRSFPSCHSGLIILTNLRE